MNLALKSHHLPIASLSMTVFVCNGSLMSDSSLLLSSYSTVSGDLGVAIACSKTCGRWRDSDSSHPEQVSMMLEFFSWS